MDVVALHELARQVVGGVGDDRDRWAHGGDPTLPPCPRRSSPGPRGWSGRTSCARCVERGDDVRALLRSTAREDNLADLAYERATATCSTVAACGEPCAASTGCSTRPGGRRCACPRPTCTASTSTAPASCSRSACGRAWSAWSTPRGGRDRPRAGAGRPPTRRQVFNAGAYGIPYVNAKHEAEVEALRLAARGLPVVIVNPGTCSGRGDVYRSSTELVRRFLRRQIPAYVDGALNIVDAATSPAATCSPTSAATPGERYILGNRNYTLDRLFADLGRVSRRRAAGGQAAAARRARPRRGPGGCPGGRRSRWPRCGRQPVVDVPQHEGQARAGVAPVPARGHDRGHGRLVPGA